MQTNKPTIVAGAFTAMTLLLALVLTPPAWSGGKVTQAVARLHSAQGHYVKGTVYFRQMPNGVQVLANVEGLSEGKHGFHIHERGDCTGDEFKTAQGHYNPDGHPHAGPSEEKRHMGDLGNITAGSDGKAHFEVLMDYIELNGPKSIVGRSVVIHAGEDDLITQPSGDAGPRVACGVIGISKPAQ